MTSNKALCPSCGGSASKAFTTQDFNRSITQETFDYYGCPMCGLLFLHPVPSDLSIYYPEDYYTIPPSIDRLHAIAEKQRYQIELVQRFVPSGNLLEIGPAYGVFAHMAKEAGFCVEVIEMDDRCCGYLREVVGVDVVKSSTPVDALSGVRPKGVIALWHVIEHLQDPWKLLDGVVERLTPNGVLLIATPNPEALQFRLLGYRWPHIDAPRHLQLIPVELLIGQMGRRGLKPVLLTSSDKGAASWNAFGWQRTLMNLTRQHFLRMFGWGCGLVLSKIWYPFERQSLKGSAYTVIFQKVKDL